MAKRHGKKKDGYRFFIPMSSFFSSFFFIFFPRESSHRITIFVSFVSLGETRVVRKRTPTHGPINRPITDAGFYHLRLTHFDNRRGKSASRAPPPPGWASEVDRWKEPARWNFLYLWKLSVVSEIDVAPGGSSMGTLFKQRTLRAPCKCKRPLLPDLVVSRMNVSTGWHRPLYTR